MHILEMNTLMKSFVNKHFLSDNHVKTRPSDSTLPSTLMTVSSSRHPTCLTSLLGPLDFLIGRRTKLKLAKNCQIKSRDLKVLSEWTDKNIIFITIFVTSCNAVCLIGSIRHHIYLLLDHCLLIPHSSLYQQVCREVAQ